MSKPIDIRSWHPWPVSWVKVRPPEYAEDLKEILISESTIKNRVSQLALTISDHYSQESLLAICILEGARTFFEYLAGRLLTDVNKEYLKVGSYEGTESTGKVWFGDFDYSKIKGRRVLLVEDIIDTGRTLSEIVKKINFYNPASLEIACLLSKPERRKAGFEVDIDYLGFIIPDKFGVGFGLDFNGKFRDLNHLGVLKEEAHHQ